MKCIELQCTPGPEVIKLFNAQLNMELTMFLILCDPDLSIALVLPIYQLPQHSLRSN